MLVLISLFAFYKPQRRKLPCHGLVSTGHPLLPCNKVSNGHTYIQAHTCTYAWEMWQHTKITRSGESETLTHAYNATLVWTKHRNTHADGKQTLSLGGLSWHRANIQGGKAESRNTQDKWRQSNNRLLPLSPSANEVKTLVNVGICGNTARHGHK